MTKTEKFFRFYAMCHFALTAGMYVGDLVTPAVAGFQSIMVGTVLALTLGE